LYFDGPELKPRVIAREPGGYISVVPLLQRDRRFAVASTLFKPGFDAATSALRLYPLDRGELPESFPIGDMPYTHRVAVLDHAGRTFVLASTLCAAKSEKEDWTQPGGIHLF